MKTQPSTYEAAKVERTTIITNWMIESLTSEPACSGWGRGALLLVLNHSLISEEEKEAEKECLNEYSNNAAYHRRMYWQSVIEHRQSKQTA